jgi:hypothetical protein
MTKISVSEAAKAVVRRNTEEVQGGGHWGMKSLFRGTTTKNPAQGQSATCEKRRY